MGGFRVKSYFENARSVILDGCALKFSVQKPVPEHHVELGSMRRTANHSRAAVCMNGDMLRSNATGAYLYHCWLYRGLHPSAHMVELDMWANILAVLRGGEQRIQAWQGCPEQHKRNPLLHQVRCLVILNIFTHAV